MYWKKRIIRNPGYHIFNLSFFLLFVFIIVYSAVFSFEEDNYPVDCIHEKITGIPCETCGISHSFSAVMQGEIQLASQFNRNGIILFLFFAIQIILRIFASNILLFTRLKKQFVLWGDVMLSGVLFLYSFKNLIIYWYSVI